MTETSVEMRIISAVSNLLAQHAARAGLHRHHGGTRPAAFRRRRQAISRSKIRATLTEKDIAAVYHAIGMEPTDRPLADFIVPLDARRNPLIGSTDVGDVSWVVPTVQVHAPTVAIGTPFHTWQVVAQGKSPHAHKAMVQAAKAMAGLGVRALTRAGPDRRRQGRPQQAHRPHALCQPAAGQRAAAAGHVADLSRPAIRRTNFLQCRRANFRAIWQPDLPNAMCAAARVCPSKNHNAFAILRLSTAGR